MKDPFFPRQSLEAETVTRLRETGLPENLPLDRSADTTPFLVVHDEVMIVPSWDGILAWHAMMPPGHVSLTTEVTIKLPEWDDDATS